MNYAIIYYSHFGNGKRIVERLASKLRGDVKVLSLAEADPAALPPADAYVFSAPAEAFSLHRGFKRFLKELPQMDGKKYGIINTHGMKKGRLPAMEALLSKKGMLKAAELDIQVAGDYKGGSGLPAGWEERADEFAGKM
ncbi:MAG: flavodoxin domain-containing protein [Methanobacteriota archaeon]